MTLILVHVEDDADIREIAAMAFDFSGGFSIIQFEDAEACLSGLNGRIPDVFLLDMMMPGMDGLELLGELRGMPDYANVPIIFMTARVQSSEINPLLNAGAIGVIAKPFEPIGLADEVHSLLQKTNL